MQLRSFKLTASNKIAAVVFLVVGLIVAMFLLGLLIILGLTLLVGVVLAALGLGIAASIYARLHRGRAGRTPPGTAPGGGRRVLLDPADEVFLPPVASKPKEEVPG